MKSLPNSCYVCSTTYQELLCSLFLSFIELWKFIPELHRSFGLKKKKEIFTGVFQFANLSSKILTEYHLSLNCSFVVFLNISVFQSNAEADSFGCFVRLLSGSVNHFCQQLDNSSVGIHSTLSRLSELLKANDEDLWQHLENTKVVSEISCIIVCCWLHLCRCSFQI